MYFFCILSILCILFYKTVVTYKTSHVCSVAPERGAGKSMRPDSFSFSNSLIYHHYHYGCGHHDEHRPGMMLSRVQRLSVYLSVLHAGEIRYRESVQERKPTGIYRERYTDLSVLYRRDPILLSRYPCTATYPRGRQTRHFRKRATSAPAEGPAYGLDLPRRYHYHYYDDYYYY